MYYILYVKCSTSYDKHDEKRYANIGLIIFELLLNFKLFQRGSVDAVFALINLTEFINC